MALSSALSGPGIRLKGRRNPGNTWLPYLEVVVLVKGPSRELRHEAQGGHVHVLAGEEEERHAAAVGHAVPGQRVVDTGLGLEEDLREEAQEREPSTAGLHCESLLHSHWTCFRGNGTCFCAQPTADGWGTAISAAARPAGGRGVCLTRCDL